jgi:hypothetical protein
VFALEKGDDFLLRRGLVGESGVKGLLGGINGGAAGFYELFYGASDAMVIEVHGEAYLDL